MEGILIPQQVFVGDTAEFLFPLSALNSFEPYILESGSFRINSIKQNSFMEVTSIQIKKQEKKEYLSINFIPWETGSISFPSLNEAGIQDLLPQVFIYSILESSNVEVLQPPRPPILIPGTSYLLYIIASVSAVMIFSAVIVFSAIKKHFFSYSFSRAQRIRIRVLNKSLKKLKKQIDSISSLEGEEVIVKQKNWLKNFEFAFRKYCFSLISSESRPDLSQNRLSDRSNRFKFNEGESLTYSEILNGLKNEFKNTYGAYFEFEKLFFRLQTFRFGNADLKKVNFEMEGMSFLSEAFKLIKIAESEIKKKLDTKQKKELKIQTEKKEVPNDKL